jgi:hypothetical protein
MVTKEKVYSEDRKRGITSEIKREIPRWQLEGGSRKHAS